LWISREFCIFARKTSDHIIFSFNLIAYFDKLFTHLTSERLEKFYFTRCLVIDGLLFGNSLCSSAGRYA